MAAAGFDQSDPMEPVLVAFSQYVEFFEQRMQLNEDRLAGVAREALEFVKQARQAADLEEKRLVAVCRKAEADLVTSFSRSLQAQVEEFLNRKGVQEKNDASMKTVVALVLVFLVSGALLYNNGYKNATVGIRETETGLQAAFRQDPEAAKKWMQLMQDNNITAALDQCAAVFPPHPPFDGHEACKIPLWLTKPPGTDQPPANRE